MLRRLLAVSIIIVSVAACGGSSATESPSAAAPSSPSASSVGSSPAPTGEVVSPSPTALQPTTKQVACTSVAIRDSASLSGKLLARVSLGVTVEVVDVITGDPYTIGACGTAGDTWLKITKVQGKKTQKLYGVPFAYAAAGLFE